jgi:hypothetical protein
VVGYPQSSLNSEKSPEWFWISSTSIWRGGVYLCKSDSERQNGFINKSMSLLSGSKEENRVMNDSYKDITTALYFKSSRVKSL